MCAVSGRFQARRIVPPTGSSAHRVPASRSLPNARTSAASVAVGDHQRAPVAARSALKWAVSSVARSHTARVVEEALGRPRDAQDGADRHVARRYREHLRAVQHPSALAWGQRTALTARRISLGADPPYPFG